MVQVSQNQKHVVREQEGQHELSILAYSPEVPNKPDERRREIKQDSTSTESPP